MRIIDKFKILTYNVGFITKPIEEILRVGVLKGDIVWLKHRFKDRFFADPFLLDENEDFWFVVCEEFLFFEEKGKITLLKVRKMDFSLFERKVLIEETTHLSFPYCKFQSYEIYPESSESGSYWKYCIDRKSFTVISKNRVVGYPLIDCVHYLDNELWFYGSLPPSPNENLYSVSNGDGCSIKNIFEKNKNYSRAAGDFFSVNGIIYRPVQDCANRYGQFINIMKMNKIGSAGFEMEKVISINSFLNPPFCQTFHTFNVYKNIIVVDGSYDFIRFPSKFFYKKAPMLFKRRLSNGTKR